MIVVGLTGNIGMGKSTVARLFHEQGAVTIDTDAIVRDLLEDPAVVAEIRDTLGEYVVRDGMVDKQRVAEIVFGDPHLRICLEDILHPRVFARTREIITALPPDTGVVIVEAPVLFERGYQGRFDRIITVYAPEEVARARLRERGITGEEAEQRAKSQLPIGIKVRSADRVIDNSQSREKTREQVAAIYEEYIREAKRQGNN
jgi:dephospho-CoA kinase